MGYSYALSDHQCRLNLVFKLLTCWQLGHDNFDSVLTNVATS